VLGGLAFILIAGHQRWGWLEFAESKLSLVATPFYWLADVPQRLGDWGRHSVRDWQSLREENARLRDEQLILTARVAKMAALSAENARLRQLLNSAAHVDDSVLIAELVAVAPDPLRHIVVINKGEDSGVYVGQAVIDGHGLVGQVIEISRYFSRVLQISDSTHAVPVQVNRNGVRAIAEGTGLTTELQLSHVASSTDIRKGDLLETSGLGGGFPSGYPVAIVTEVAEGEGQPFLKVKARPTALLAQSRHLLLVFRPAGLEPVYSADDSTGDAEAQP
jgi:rod shape-determining protein MreC